jgi:hypothetical protein
MRCEPRAVSFELRDQSVCGLAGSGAAQPAKLRAGGTAGGTASLARTLHATMTKPNASSKPLCASGPTSTITSTPRNAINTCCPGWSFTTYAARMVVSVTFRPSVALPWVQRLDRSQPTFPLRSRHSNNRGCPTHRSFRWAGGTDLDLILLYFHPSLRSQSLLRQVIHADFAVRATHPSNPAKGG